MLNHNAGVRSGWGGLASRSFLLDLLISLFALTGLAISAYWGLSLSREAFAASDLKTLYASVWCFAHHQNAYAIPNLQAVFTANRIVQPPNWYGHAPVYPPTTLMLLMPLAWLPMVPALYVALMVFVLLLVLALTTMLRYSAETFGMGWVWRAAMVALFAAGPLLGFALTMGNISLATAALVILAFLLRTRGNVWRSAALLAGAFLLKPHIAFWLALCMLLLPEQRSRAAVLRAGVLVVIAAVITTAFMAMTGTMGLQVHGYQNILHAEMSGTASMSPASHEPLPVVAQITSFGTLIGYWAGSGVVDKLTSGAALLAMALALAWQTRAQKSSARILLAAGAWLAFGMLATYHRAHDAIVLLVLLPWAVLQVRRSPRNGYAWAAVLLYCLMSAGPKFQVLTQQARMPSIEAFLLLRQAGIAELCLFVVLMLAMNQTDQTQPVVQ